MYDNLVVNVEQLRGGGEGAAGNGCILAHCMGLGKTLQVQPYFYFCFIYPRTTERIDLLFDPVVCPAF